MEDTISYIENNFPNFSALNFCKHFSLNSKNQAATAFESSLTQISIRNLKTKGCNKPLITWARSYNKKKIIHVNKVPF